MLTANFYEQLCLLCLLCILCAISRLMLQLRFIIGFLCGIWKFQSSPQNLVSKFLTSCGNIGFKIYNYSIRLTDLFGESLLNGRKNTNLNSGFKKQLDHKLMYYL